MAKANFQPGDWVVYRKSKQSIRPGPRAEQVTPAKAGDLYSYVVDKFWVVLQVNDDGSLLLQTRRGKQHLVTPGDPSLRKANLWHRLRYRDRFEAAQQAQSDSNDPNADNR